MKAIAFTHQLHGLITGRLEIKKTAENGKETVMRLNPPGELFAAPAIFGNGIAPATVICQIPSQILTIDREALLQVIARSPEISLRILEVFNQRLQQLHNTAQYGTRVNFRTGNGASSEIASVLWDRDGTSSVPQGERLNTKLPYYQIARSIGITYEECVRLFKKLQGIAIYQRGGTIIVRDWKQLAAASII